MQFRIASPFIALAGSLLIALPARATERGEKPEFVNPHMLHVAVENTDPSAYLYICPNVCELPSRRLLIAYHRTTRVDFSGLYSTWTRASDDGGKTWSEA